MSLRNLRMCRFIAAHLIGRTNCNVVIGGLDHLKFPCKLLFWLMKGDNIG